MARENLPSWQLVTAVFCTGLCLLLAWGSLQAQTPGPEPTSMGAIPHGYNVLSRAEIMLGAAGSVLN